MYNSVQIEVNSKHELFSYFEDICNKYKCLYNTTNFYIRNTMTGIKKSPEKRQYNEIEVLHYVFTSISGINDIKNKTLKKKDINGSSNILRKAFPDAFTNKKDLSYLYKSVKVINFNDFYSNRSIKYA